jgi:hypothetical protein
LRAKIKEFSKGKIQVPSFENRQNPLNPGKKEEVKTHKSKINNLQCKIEFLQLPRIALTPLEASKQYPAMK